ncbi:MAG: hypothetical protein AUH88_02100 [Acidobacteria bacterium 13_1_40CM_4_61_5]|nr:MAG: hypothetical protein AUH88_02100 [Acidobacteria bacterium 13_1_40CM_4_61_5]
MSVISFGGLPGGLDFGSDRPAGFAESYAPRLDSPLIGTPSLSIASGRQEGKPVKRKISCAALLLPVRRFGDALLILAAGARAQGNAEEPATAQSSTSAGAPGSFI